MSEPDSFLKRHGFLIAGVALPILVVIVFVLARTLPSLWVDDLRYDVLYAMHTNYGVQPRKLEGSVAVVDGGLRVRWSKTENPVYMEPPRVYRFRSATETVEEVALPEPEDVDRLDGTADLPVAGLEGFRIDTSPRSPDGYEFDGSQGSGSGLLNEILVSRSRPMRTVLRKGGRAIVLPTTDSSGYGYSPVRFLGWLVPVEGGRGGR